MNQTFGKPLTLSFTPMVDRDVVKIDSIVSVRVYEALPSDDQINDSTNSGGDFVVGSTSSSDFVLVGNNEWEISLDALTAPEVGERGWERYYYAINYKYTSTGATVGAWESFTVYYPDGIGSRLKLRPSDIYAFQSDLEQQLGDDKVLDKIQAAEELLMDYLNGKKMDRQYLRESDLRQCFRHWTLYLCCNDVSSNAGDAWEVKAVDYERKYNDDLKNLSVAFDASRDNVIDDDLDEVKPKSGIILR